MPASLNKVTLIGNLGADPEIRSFQNGGRVANLRLATSKRWKDKQTGKSMEKTEWHRVAVFNEGLIKVVEKHLKSGSQVYIEGALETSEYTDKENVKRYSTEITLRPYNGELKILTWQNGKDVPAEDAEDLPEA